MTHPTSARSGFTLVELAIVLVIIGLLVGGVLAGQDLIKQAEVRSTLSQLSTFDTGVNTFRGKYAGLPGDLASPGNYGFDATGVAGDADGLIETSADTTGLEFNQEGAAFFRHLFQANLISETVTATDFTAASVDAIATYAPPAKIGRGALWTARQTAGVNYFLLSVPTVTNGALTIADGGQIPVIAAYGIDSKLDDGIPTTGKVVAVTTFNTADAGAAAADNTCVNTTPNPVAYNLTTTARQNDTECSIRIQASF